MDRDVAVLGSTRGSRAIYQRTTMNITGACHCGRITFTASVDPAAVSICHCTDCQTLSGAPWRASVACAAADFAVAGEPKVTIKVADSGARRV